MIILGIDPGTTRIGYALLKKEKNGDAKLIDCGCLEILNETQIKRLGIISDQIGRLTLKHRPEILAIERLFFNKNIKTAMAVSEARGVIINSANSLGLKILEFTPLQVKTAITGYGRAKKLEVQKMICLILNLKKAPQPDDTSDAIAIGLAACYTNEKLLI